MARTDLQKEVRALREQVNKREDNARESFRATIEDLWLKAHGGTRDIINKSYKDGLTDEEKDLRRQYQRFQSERHIDVLYPDINGEYTDKWNSNLKRATNSDLHRLKNLYSDELKEKYSFYTPQRQRELIARTFESGKIPTDSPGSAKNMADVIRDLTDEQMAWLYYHGITLEFLYEDFDGGDVPELFNVTNMLRAFGTIKAESAWDEWQEARGAENGAEYEI